MDSGDTNKRPEIEANIGSISQSSQHVYFSTARFSSFYKNYAALKHYDNNLIFAGSCSECCDSSNVHQHQWDWDEGGGQCSSNIVLSCQGSVSSWFLILKDCKYSWWSGEPKPVVTWRRADGESINLQHRGGQTMVQGPVLQLGDLRPRDAGVYMCVAKNGNPPAIVQNIKLNVMCKIIMKNLCNAGGHLPSNIFLSEYFSWTWGICYETGAACSCRCLH